MSERNGDGQVYEAPPHDKAAEQCVLACFQWDDDLFNTVSLKTEDFYHSHHQTIYRVMLDLHNKGIPSDAVTVTSALRVSPKSDLCCKSVFEWGIHVGWFESFQ